MDYSSTLNLPKTKFPMKANLPVSEPEIQRFWEEKGVYKKLLERTQGRPKFILHDGPPYANGDIHIGTALNKVLKDIVVRFASLDGFYAPYVPGWDTHGLPIELQMLKSLGMNKENVSPTELRKACREFALKYKDIQKEQFKRLGVRGDWENPYLTLDPKYEAKQILVFGEMLKKGYIYKGLKPVYWCPSCETALAEAEVEYKDARSPSIYVRFKVADGKGVVPNDASFVIWTTTPWTLPANLAICVHPEREYAVVETTQGKMVLAVELVDRAMKDMHIPEYRVLGRVLGSALEGVLCSHPFVNRTSLVILGGHVTVQEGTGCVHTAPGHGQEDFEVGERYNLGVIQPIDSKGYFTSEAGEFQGLFYRDANVHIIRVLKQKGALVAEGTIVHQYPHCWRCKSPLLFRATEQWFASVQGFREEALRAIDEVKWVPPWGKDRMRNMVAERSDWCISRQRVWGVPIPVFYCKKCRKPLVTDSSIKAVAKLFEREGSDAWFTREAREVLPPGTACPECGCTEFEKETDIMDVWFDSGSSHAAVLEVRPELKWPATIYLEGSDQHRGWFQSSLLTAVATKGRAPYEIVLTHGFVVDGEGRKMSKSLGNVISPLSVIARYGADVLRLWVASSDYSGDVRISEDILKQLAEVYRKIRNTFRFILGNLYDFDPNADGVEYEELLEIDKWALSRVSGLTKKVTQAYRSFQYHLIYHDVHNFCVVDMSNFYLDILKDRLYCDSANSKARRAAQTALYQIARVLVRLLDPILPHTMEEVWQHLPKLSGDPESVELCSWPEGEARWEDETLEAKWNKVLELRDYVAKALEEARTSKLIGSSLEARVTLVVKDEGMLEFLRGNLELLKTVFIVSQLEVATGMPSQGVGAAVYENDKLAVVVNGARGAKCSRCWTYSEDTGRDPAFPETCPRCARVLKEVSAQAG
ncbi:MAG: isoleucine--tRNA ligase [Bacillota bacterium]